APEIAGLLRARAARLLHPGVAAVAVEGGRVVPDPVERTLTHARELEPREHARRVAGKRDAVRGDHEEPRAPAVHARLGAALVVVRYHEEDAHAAADARAKRVGDRLRAREL